MYKDTSQMTIEDFVFPFGTLDPDNRWVRMASFVPWDEIEKSYAKSFGKTGAPAHPARMAFGALLLKQCLGTSDAELVNQIAENPYLGFFIGCKSFDEGCPFGAS
ncbi:MAG: transposase, partial [Hungatella sp.]